MVDSPVIPPPDPEREVMGSPVLLRYIGSSMHPTFREGDELLVIPLEDTGPRKGDVIAFILLGEERTIVHRVEIDGEVAIRTRGDASGEMDPWILHRELIRGRVEYVRTDRGWRRVGNGTSGVLHARTIRFRKWLAAPVKRILDPVYRALSSSAALKRLGRTLPLRTVVFHSVQGPEYQIQLSGLVIGRCLPGRMRWRIRTPFRLLVDEKDLPVSAGKGPETETAE